MSTTTEIATRLAVTVYFSNRHTLEMAFETDNVAEAIGLALMTEVDAEGGFHEAPLGIVVWEEWNVFSPENGDFVWTPRRPMFPERG